MGIETILAIAAVTISAGSAVDQGIRTRAAAREADRAARDLAADRQRVLDKEANARKAAVDKEAALGSSAGRNAGQGAGYGIGAGFRSTFLSSMNTGLGTSNANPSVATRGNLFGN